MVVADGAVEWLLCDLTFILREREREIERERKKEREREGERERKIEKERRS